MLHTIVLCCALWKRLHEGKLEFLDTIFLTIEGLSPWIKKAIRLSEVTLAIVHVIYDIVQLDVSSNQVVLENHRDHFQAWCLWTGQNLLDEEYISEIFLSSLHQTTYLISIFQWFNPVCYSTSLSSIAELSIPVSIIKLNLRNGKMLLFSRGNS